MLKIKILLQLLFVFYFSSLSTLILISKLFSIKLRIKQIINPATDDKARYFNVKTFVNMKLGLLKI